MHYNVYEEVFCITTNIGKYIREYRGDDSLRDFAKKCGISHTHLDSIEKGEDPRTGKPVRITVETLTKIAKTMNMSVNELLINCGEVDSEKVKQIKLNSSIRNLDHISLEIIELLNGMDQEKKESILNFIKTFK